MKRAIPLILALVLCFGLCACRNTVVISTTEETQFTQATESFSHSSKRDTMSRADICRAIEKDLEFYYSLTSDGEITVEITSIEKTFEHTYKVYGKKKSYDNWGNQEIERFTIPGVKVREDGFVDIDYYEIDFE